MQTIGTWGAAIEIAGFSICCFALILSVTQWRLMAAYGLLACLFLTLMLSDLFDVASIVVRDMGPGTAAQLLVVSYISAFFVSPALLIYVRSVTGQSLVRGRGEALAHLALPGVAALSGAALVLLVPPATAVGVPPPVDEAPGIVILFVGLIEALPFAFYLQCMIYAALVMRAQMRHRERLKDLFASTEPHEIRWITGMAILFGSFAILNLLSLVNARLDGALGLPGAVDSALELMIVLTLGLWGLRQSPGLAELAADADAHDEITHVKYEKSALDPERADRIARKLHVAMDRDQLFRDANLSLMGLSQHVGVTTNYVSQTLNAHLGISFFDFVNGWRVEASKPMIVQGDQPITLIAYEAGFNSRSSFYTAFKKNTGMTPSQYHDDAQGYVADIG